MLHNFIYIIASKQQLLVFLDDWCFSKLSTDRIKDCDALTQCLAITKWFVSTNFPTRKLIVRETLYRSSVTILQQSLTVGSSSKYTWFKGPLSAVWLLDNTWDRERFTHHFFQVPDLEPRTLLTIHFQVFPLAARFSGSQKKFQPSIHLCVRGACRGRFAKKSQPMNLLRNLKTMTWKKKAQSSAIVAFWPSPTLAKAYLQDTQPTKTCSLITQWPLKMPYNMRHEVLRMKDHMKITEAKSKTSILCKFDQILSFHHVEHFLRCG